MSEPPAENDQFDSRYARPPRFAPNPGVEKRSRFIVSRQVDLQREIRHRPSEIGWFEERLLAPRIPDGKKVVAFYCNMIPVEVALALDAVPVRLDCGNPALVQAGEEVLSGEVCPLAKSSYAAYLDPQGVPARADCVVVAGSCDAKRKLGEALSDYKPTFVLPLPPEQDYARYWKPTVAEFERLVEWLEERVGRSMKTSDLRRAVDLCRRRTRLVREIVDARSANPEALSYRDLIVVLQSSYPHYDLEEWLRRAAKVLAEVKGHVPARKRLRPRLVLTGAPILWPNMKPLNLIEECGADVVADTLCTGAQGFWDPVVGEEDGRSALLKSLAQRYVFATPCPCFVSGAKRLSLVLDLVDRHGADGVVHYGLRLCPLYDMETHRVSSVLKEKKVPFMVLRTDYSLEDTEQLRVRLEAFLETLGEPE